MGGADENRISTDVRAKSRQSSPRRREGDDERRPKATWSFGFWAREHRRRDPPRGEGGYRCGGPESRASAPRTTRSEAAPCRGRSNRKAARRFEGTDPRPPRGRPRMWSLISGSMRRHQVRRYEAFVEDAGGHNNRVFYSAGDTYRSALATCTACGEVFIVDREDRRIVGP